MITLFQHLFPLQHRKHKPTDRPGWPGITSGNPQAPQFGVGSATMESGTTGGHVLPRPLPDRCPRGSRADSPYSLRSRWAVPRNWGPASQGAHFTQCQPPRRSRHCSMSPQSGQGSGTSASSISGSAARDQIRRPSRSITSSHSSPSFSWPSWEGSAVRLSPSPFRASGST